MMADLICITFETLAKHSHHQGFHSKKNFRGCYHSL